MVLLLGLDYLCKPLIFLFIKWRQAWSCCIKRDGACESRSTGTCFLFPVSATEMFVLLLCLQVPLEESELLLQNLQSGGPRDCVVLMAAAGHFAGAIFQG